MRPNRLENNTTNMPLANQVRAYHRALGTNAVFPDNQAEKDLLNLITSSGGITSAKPPKQNSTQYPYFYSKREAQVAVETLKDYACPPGVTAAIPPLCEDVIALINRNIDAANK